MTLPSSGNAAEPFPGYPSEVREAAGRVVAAARPGLEDVLEPSVQSLRKAMFDHAILSINAIPDKIFERARREGWRGKAGQVLRPVVRVAPYSVSLWAWLIREDLVTLRLDRLLKDLEGLEGALRQYGPALLGCASWVLLLTCAAVSWFVVWASISLLLRAQPALASDLARPFRWIPHPEIPGFLAFLACFLAPMLAGLGIGVAAVFWFALSAGYLRRWELVTAAAAILLLGAVFLCGGGVQSLARITGETQRGGWLSEEGYYPREWPDATAFPGGVFAGPRWRELVTYARARAEMQGGTSRRPSRCGRNGSDRRRNRLQDTTTAGSYGCGWARPRRRWPISGRRRPWAPRGTRHRGTPTRCTSKPSGWRMRRGFKAPPGRR